MRIISKSLLKKAYQINPDCKTAIETWVKLVESSDWCNVPDVINGSTFSPDYVKPFVVFNIRGNKYRLITYIDYESKSVYIRYFLTHAEYDNNTWRR